jgi:hypothetical protein
MDGLASYKVGSVTRLSTVFPKNVLIYGEFVADGRERRGAYVSCGQ